jgi:hypothetical protein
MIDRRKLAKDFLVMGTREARGRRQYDPVFEAITEKRQGSKYSGCADLAHWLLFRLGFRQDWLNRKEHKGWKVARNLSLLCSRTAGGANPVAMPPVSGQEVGSGDVLVVNVQDPQRSHVVVVVDQGVLENGTTLATAEYGQFDAKYGRASGKMFSRSVRVAGSGKIRLGASSLDSVLPLGWLLGDTEHLVDPADPRGYYELVASRQRLLRVTKPPMRGNDVLWWQEELTERRFKPGRPDSVFGARTSAATSSFQSDAGLTPSAVVSLTSWIAMMGWSEVE